jgi:hypothetical protein
MCCATFNAFMSIYKRNIVINKRKKIVIILYVHGFDLYMHGSSSYRTISINLSAGGTVQQLLWIDVELGWSSVLLVLLSCVDFSKSPILLVVLKKVNSVMSLHTDICTVHTEYTFYNITSKNILPEPSQPGL